MPDPYRYRIEPPGGPDFDVELDHSLVEGDVFDHGGWIFCVNFVRRDRPEYDGVIEAETVGKVGPS